MKPFALRAFSYAAVLLAVLPSFSSAEAPASGAPAAPEKKPYLRIVKTKTCQLLMPKLATCVFTIKVTNVGNAGYSGPLWVTDTLTPATSMFQGFSQPATPPGTVCAPAAPINSITCKVPSVTLPISGSVSISFQAMVKVASMKEAWNCASVVKPVQSPVAKSCVHL